MIERNINNLHSRKRILAAMSLSYVLAAVRRNPDMFPNEFIMLITHYLKEEIFNYRPSFPSFLLMSINDLQLLVNPSF